MGKAIGKRVGFVVMRVGWEYNDEYYHRPDSEGGKPVKVFNTQAEAQAYRNQLNNVEVCANEKQEYHMTDRNDNNITNFFEVVEVEMG